MADTSQLPVPTLDSATHGTGFFAGPHRIPIYSCVFDSPQTVEYNWPFEDAALCLKDANTFLKAHCKLNMLEANFGWVKSCNTTN